MKIDKNLFLQKAIDSGEEKSLERCLSENNRKPKHVKLAQLTNWTEFNGIILISIACNPPQKRR